MAEMYECRARLLEALPTRPAAEQFNIDRIAHQYVWANDDFEVGFQISGSCSELVIDQVLIALERVTVLDLRAMRACMAEEGVAHG